VNSPCQSPSLRRVFDDETAQHIARAICQRCPDLAPCREQVLNQEAAGDPVHGVAGGLLPGERPHAVRMERPYPSARRNAGQWRNQYSDGPHPEHGTMGAWRRHERRDETLCDPCLIGRRAWYRERNGSWRDAATVAKTRLSRDARRVRVMELTRQGMSARQVAASLGIHTRTVVRDRAALSDAHLTEAEVA